MERLIEKFVCKNTRCYTCGSLVYAVEQKKTTNHVYHNRCFRCRICKRSLTESTLNEEGDDIYCTNCYRKKQRGDCSGLDFKRAAEERGQYVHNRRHPDQSPPKPNPRPPSQPGFSRQTSWNLRQLERQVLSNPGPNTAKFEASNDSRALPIKTSYSTPNYLTNIRQYLSSIGNEPSPTSKFFPLNSPGYSSTTRTESTSRSPSTSRSASTSRTPPPPPVPRTPPPPQLPRTPSATFQAPFQFNRVRLQDNKLKLFNDPQPRLNKSSIDLTNTRTPPVERKHSLFNTGNPNYENQDRRLSLGRFYFPDTYVTPNHRRSNSVNYSVSPRKIQGTY